MNSQLKELIERVRGEAAELNESLQPPATEMQIESLRQEAKRELNAILPEEYFEFLRIVNGLSWENLYIYASEKSPHATHPEDDHFDGFVYMNKAWRTMPEDNDLLFFGESGNMDFYVQQISTGEFQILDHGSLSVTHRFKEFDELMIEALEIRM
jgi:hypothetical protein